MIFNSNFEILAWKLYFQTVFNKKTAEKLCRNHGRNVVISGYPGADGYREPADKDVWKVKDRSKKRIIWAPHFSIVKGIGFYKSSFFLEMADYMRTIALEYVDSITIAFKPHPRLFSELCKHPNWGEKKAEEYYNFWESSENTQIETGDFVDLFKGSDAMIHDSGSFVVDYLYFNKPVMFDNPNIEDVKTTADELGVKAYDAHYRAEGLSDIKKFIDEVVIGGKDPMKETRTQFLNDFLRSSDGRTASQIIYDDLVESLWGTNNK